MEIDGLEQPKQIKLINKASKKEMIEQSSQKIISVKEIFKEENMELSDEQYDWLKKFESWKKLSNLLDIKGIKKKKRLEIFKKWAIVHEG